MTKDEGARVKSYLRRWLAEAVQRTRSFLGWNRKNLMWALAYGIGLAAYGALRGFDMAREELVVWLVAGIAPVAALAVGLFLWNLVAAPPNLWLADASEKQDLEAEIETLRARIRSVEESVPQIELGTPYLVPDQTLIRTQLVNVDSNQVTRGRLERHEAEQLTVGLWRIPVTNRGASAPRISVRIARVDPLPRSGLYPAALHRAGDNPPDGVALTEWFPLLHGASESIDFIAMARRIVTGELGRVFLYKIASPDRAEEFLDAGTFRFTLQALADEATVERRYEAFVDRGEGTLRVTALN